MKIVIFSDLHGNPYACEALIQMARAEQANTIVIAGDVCLGGSDPAACVDMLRSAGAVGVYGNTEVYLANPDQTPQDDHHRPKWYWIQPAVRWTLEQLSTDQQNWVLSLPFSLHIPPPGAAETEPEALLVLHANPVDPDMMIYPAPEIQHRLWGEVRQPDDDPALAAVFTKVIEQTIVFGHYHFPGIRFWRGYRLVNVASAGLPGVDHDWRARASLFTWTGNSWSIEQRWIDYGAEREIEALRKSDMPSNREFMAYYGVT